MTHDDLMAAFERLLDPSEDEAAAAHAEQAVVPYWLVPSEGGEGASADALRSGLGPDLAGFLSDGFAGQGGVPEPSLAAMAAYVDGTLEGAARDAFEAALVASPELRAEIEMLSQNVALFEV